MTAEDESGMMLYSGTAFYCMGNIDKDILINVLWLNDKFNTDEKSTTTQNCV